MSSSVSGDMYEEIQGETNWLERLARKIPGFKGYLEKRDRREADQLLREALSARLEETRLKFSGVHQELSSDIIKAIDFAEALGRVDNALMGLIGKIKDAPQGYAGFFDAVKVDETDLQRIYEFDNSMSIYADNIVSAVAALEKAVRDDMDIKGAIRTLDEAVKEANVKFASRQEILSGIA